MAEHLLQTSLTLDLPRQEVFEFFSNAENLEKITPPGVGFEFITPPPIEMGVGTLIDYKLSLFGIPIKWRTEITKWDPPNEFEDIQVWGPYKQWIHRHTFKELGPRTTVIEDVVRYRLPVGSFGDIAHFIVEGQLAKIFAYREKRVLEILVKKVV
jgi:ligand-binding SRPBCC domain-containing protein